VRPGSLNWARLKLVKDNSHDKDTNQPKTQISQRQKSAKRHTSTKDTNQPKKTKMSSTNVSQRKREKKIIDIN
jgi:hypothetical protein